MVLRLTGFFISTQILYVMGNLLSRGLLALLLFGSAAQSLTAGQWWWNGRATLTNVGTNTCSYRVWWTDSDDGQWSTDSDATATVNEVKTIDIPNTIVAATKPAQGPNITIRIRVGTAGAAPANNSTERDAAQYVYTFTGLVETTQNTYTTNPLPSPYNGLLGCAQTITLDNVGLRIVRGYWSLNGSVIYTEDIPPGGSKTHTITPPDCNDAEIKAWTVTLMLNEDLELVPTTNIWDTIIDPVTPGTNSLPIWWQQPNVPSIEPGFILTNTTGNFHPPINFTPGADQTTIIKEGFTSIITDERVNDGMMLELLSRIQENTLGTKTNLNPNIPPTSEMQTAAGASVGWSNSINAKQGDVTLSTSIGGSVPDLNVTIGPAVLNLNPFAIPGIASMAGGVRTFLVWLGNLVWALAAFKVVRGLLVPVLLAPQGTAASATPIASSGSALVMAGIVVAIMGAAALGLVGYVTVNAAWSGAMSTPFTGVVGTAAALFDTICPTSHLLGLLVAWFIFEVAATALAAGASLAVRFFVGCLAGLLLQVEAQAAEVQMFNGSSNVVSVASMSVPSGQTAWFNLSGSQSVSDGSGTVAVTLSTSALVVERLQVSGSGVGLAVGQETIDLAEGFWLGMVSAAGMWSVGFMYGLLRRFLNAGGAE